MLQLPFEVLELIFRQLPQKDLLQCQLTCKQWREASTGLLYYHVKMTPGFKYVEFCRTISSSPQLANRLKYFVPEFVSAHFENYILKVLIESCPNILDLSYESASANFWVQLMQAANRGKLSHLASLPNPEYGTLDWHNCTSLLFSKSLTTLTLYQALEIKGYCGCKYLPSYFALYNSIKEFSNVKYLVIGYSSDKLLSHWDAVIEELPRLKTLLFISASIRQKKVPPEFTGSVIPSDTIEDLKCHWNLIKCDDQLQYLMQKFTKLKSLEVKYCAFKEGDWYLRSTGLSMKVMLDYLQYASTIPKICISFDVRDEDFDEILVRCLHMLSGPRHVTIRYIDSYETFEQQSMDLTNESLRINYALQETELALPQLVWLSKVGGMIRSLSINTDFVNLDLFLKELEHFKTNNWMYQTIQLCPILQEFTITCPPETPFSLDIPFRHNELKSFTIKLINHEHALGCLEAISLLAPNLNSLQLEYSFYVSTGAKINMPYTSFDCVTLVLSSFKPAISNLLSLPNGFQYCVRFKTTLIERFGVYRNKELRYVTKEAFEELASKIYCVDITCAKLDKFVMRFPKQMRVGDHIWKLN